MATAASPEAPQPGFPTYPGLCTLCGKTGTFEFGNHRSVRESYPCPHCRFPLRWRDQASLILDEFGNGQVLSFNALVEGGHLDHLSIYEPALRGPFTRQLNGKPNYTRSYFWPDRAPGSIGPDGVRNESLTALTFPDNSFDLIITSDVMEHLLDIDAAYAEITRVLKPGGVHIFSIPTHYPLPDKTVARVELRDGVEVNVLPPVYHSSGDNTPCIVYHDYGTDLPARIDRHGSQTRIVRRTGSVDPCVRNATFITRKHLTADTAAARAAAPSRTAPAAAPAARTEAAPPAARPATAGGRGTPSVECPICGSHDFEEFNGRRNARCKGCRSVERHRLMAMVLDHFSLFREGLRVFHVAPEPTLASRFQKALGDNYVPCDLKTRSGGAGSKDRLRIDLCADLETMPDNSFDVIIHSHVLAHVPCDVTGVMRQFHRLLKDDGHHLFSVAMRGEYTAEDLSPDLSPERRMKLFGQTDNMRMFGRHSLEAMLSEVWGEGQYFLNPFGLFGAETLIRCCIPEAAWTGSPNNHGVFYNRAPQALPARPLAPGVRLKPASAPAPARPAARPAPSATRAPAARPDDAQNLLVSTLTTGLTSRNAAQRRLETASWILHHLAPAAAYPRLVDLGSGPGHFAKLAQSMGHAATAVDGRTERVPPDLGDVVFRHEDVRDVDLSAFDVILCLGLFYHLEAADQVALLERCPQDAVFILDTQVWLEDLPGIGNFLGDRISPFHTGVLDRYDGIHFKEQETAMASIGNPESFFPTEESLLAMFADTGFQSVMLVDPAYYTPAGGRRWYVGRK